ncbi:polygalacturonase [Halanaerobium saccharolyticum]|uniref:Polygalacturonase n=1 Tax=Halanaerobium saccharolyticum TaxID=43595 RepID=A0A4R7YWP9_9FIRM|nr:glycoside hydrolase family 28 protein [Halanaerobium saccharolyticum]RAK06881.1 polygalacturonase [Halanaerobium saccharolyticum]TDW01491.1 polygalacturonase [Halanaerobium saccharolyticum]TDX52852.1 polygalacturonase [Halanaerobium saccharolyticum]
MNNSFYNILDFGAKRDGKTLNTAAFKKAVKKCSECGGGEIYIPAGDYLSGSIRLESNITLNISAGAKIIFSNRPEDHEIILQRWEGKEQKVYSPLIYAKNAENVTIKGQGMIDGQGKKWWHLFENNKLKYARPRGISFENCSNILIEGVKIKNSPAWTVNPIKSDKITINKVSIKNPPNSPNTDGINPSSCKNVHISDCHVDVGDDCITIKSGTEKGQDLIPCENITVTNCTIVHGHGGVVIGSEMSGSVRNVTINNCVFDGTDRGIRIKSRRGRGGVVEDIVVNNIVMNNVLSPVIMNLFYFCGEGGKDKFVWDKNPKKFNSQTPVIREVHFNNIRANNVKTRAIFIYGLPESPIKDITFSNVSITMADQAEAKVPAMMSKLKAEKQKGVYCNNFKDIDFINFKVKNQIGKKFELLNAK